MSVRELVSALQERREQDRGSALAKYYNLVRAAADENLPDAETAHAILDAADKSPEQLRDEVDAVLHRRRLQALIATAGETRERRRNLDAEIEAQKERFAQLEAEHLDRMTQLAAERRQVDGQLQKIADAENELARAVPDTEEEIELQSERNEHSSVLMAVGIAPTNEAKKQLHQDREAARKRMAEIDARLNEIKREKALTGT